MLVVVLLVASLFHSCAYAQGNAISNPPMGITLRDNLKATMSVMLLGFFSAFVFMTFFRLYLRHCSNGSNNAMAVDLCGGGFNREVIDKCPILVYSTVKDLKMGKGALECAVCLSEFEDRDRIRLLPKCHHVFHPDCIDGWLLSHMKCPVCRARLTHDSVVDIAIPIIPPQLQLGEQSSTVTESVSETETVISPRERSVLRKFPRSHSTGHSLVDRYTLRFAEDVSVDLGGEWCSKSVLYRSSTFLSITPVRMSFHRPHGIAQTP
ncbi:hypothetical protein VNO77_44075 [Canavalia gladiata]|uniref:RING-type E3 ubiquitin transferase n=1 Tax=Canavalia gladiata TaxID=3824 RepID=A0AAN9PQM7_CANGL